MFHTPHARKKRVKQIVKVAPGVVYAGMAGAIAFNAMSPSIMGGAPAPMDRGQAQVEQQYVQPSIDGDMPEPQSSADPGPEPMIPMTGEDTGPILGSDYQSPVQSGSLSPAAEYIMDQWNTNTSGVGNEYGAGSGVTQQSGDYLSSQGFSNAQIAEAAQQAGAERDAQGIVEGYTLAGTVDLSVGTTSVYDDVRETRFGGLDQPGIPYEPVLSGPWEIPGSEGTQSITSAQLTPEDQVKVRQVIEESRLSNAEVGRVEAERPVWWGIAEADGHTAESYPFHEIPGYTPVGGLSPTIETAPSGPIGEIQDSVPIDNIHSSGVEGITEVPTAQSQEVPLPVQKGRSLKVTPSPLVRQAEAGKIRSVQPTKGGLQFGSSKLEAYGLKRI